MALKMQVDATAVFGLKDGNESQPYLAIYLAAEFPAGIPLFATGLGRVWRGRSVRDEHGTEPRSLARRGMRCGSDGPTGITAESGSWRHESSKMEPRLQAVWPLARASRSARSPTTVTRSPARCCWRLSSLVQFSCSRDPRAFCSERATLADDANFRALAVLDGRAGTLQLGLDAKYRYNNNGNLDRHSTAPPKVSSTSTIQMHGVSTSA